MCGIVGAVSLHDPGRLEWLRLEASLETLARRGPDATGIHEDAHVRLGHRRLAIIDERTTANQPMLSACGRYVIVFNGEVYNFGELRSSLAPAGGWRSDSDTETILQAYVELGPACLDRFHGMFAFAIWDKIGKKLFLARDRLGVKPLYFAQSAGFLAFASRPGALRALVPDLALDIDQQALRWYLESGYVPAPHSIYQGVRKLCPGEYLIFDLAGVQLRRYWSLDEVGIDTRADARGEDDLLDELSQLVDRSVRWRLVSSVPVGAFLSGGIDSSLVVSRMARIAGPGVRTFTIGFSDEAYDESSQAQEIARLLGTQHRSELLTAQSLLDLLPAFVSEFDEPFYDYSALATMAVSRLAARDVKVALSGDGGDEAFGGYHYYRAVALMKNAYRAPAVVRKLLAAGLRHMPGNLGLAGWALRQDSITGAFAYARSVIKHRDRIMVDSLRSNTRSLASLFAESAQRFSATLSAEEAAMRLDLRYTLPDDYLQKVDVASMAFSLEAREPLLDHSIIEWAARLPTHWKLRDGRNKYLLRQLVYRDLPRDLMDRPKRGFGVPMASWLRGELRDWCLALLSDSHAMEQLGLEPIAVRALWHAHQARETEAASTLWAVLMLLAFHRVHIGNGSIQ